MTDSRQAYETWHERLDVDAETDPRRRAWVAGAGRRVNEVDGVGHYLPFPRRPPVEVPLFNEPRLLTRWFGLHSLVVAEKP